LQQDDWIYLLGALSTKIFNPPLFYNYCTHYTVRSENHCALIKDYWNVHDPPVSIFAPLLLCTRTGLGFIGPLYVLLQARYLTLASNYAMILMDSAA
jgi:hypothetical protein